MSNDRARATGRQVVMIALAVVAMFATACSPSPSGPAPSTQRFCELWDDMAEIEDPTREPVLVDDDVVALAESTTTSGSSCTDPGARVGFTDATLAEVGEVEVLDVEDPEPTGGLRSLEEGDPAPETALSPTGERLTAAEPVLNNVELKSISAWIDHRGITLQGAVDITLSNVTSTIGFQGTLRDLQNWSISLASSAFTVPGITSTPATFHGSLVVTGGVPSLTLQAGIASAQIGDVTITGASLNVHASPSTGVAATVSGAIDIGPASVEGEVAVAFDSKGSLVSARAELDASLRGRLVGGDLVRIDGHAKIDANATTTSIKFNGSGNIGDLVVRSADGLLSVEDDRAVFEGMIDASGTGPDGSIDGKVHGQIIWDGEHVSMPFLDVEVSGEYSAILPSGEVLRIDGTVISETGYGGVSQTEIHGDLQLGELHASVQAVVTTESGVTGLAIDAIADLPGVVDEVELAGQALIEDGQVLSLELDATVQELLFGDVALTDIELAMRGGVNLDDLQITVVGDYAVGSLASGRIQAEATFYDGSFQSLIGEVTADLNLDGTPIEATADITVTAESLTVDLDGRVDTGAIAADVTGVLRVDFGTADWRLEGSIPHLKLGPINIWDSPFLIEPGRLETVRLSMVASLPVLGDFQLQATLYFHPDGSMEYLQIAYGLGIPGLVMQQKLADALGIPVYYGINGV